MKWTQGDASGGARVLEAAGLVSAWNDALHYLEYASPRDQLVDTLYATVTDTHGSSSNLTVPIRVQSVSCRHLLHWSVHEPLANTAAESAEEVAQMALDSAGSENRSTVQEGMSIPLSGLRLTSDCAEAAALRVVFEPRNVDDSDGPGEGADATLSYDETAQNTNVAWDVITPGTIALTSPGPTTGLGATQLNEAFGHVLYKPPDGYDGLARLLIVVEVLGKEASGSSQFELWFYIESVNDAPEITVFGAEAVVAGAFASLQASERAVPDVRPPSETDLWMLADNAAHVTPFFQAIGAGILVSDDEDALLTVTIVVSWISEHAVQANDAATTVDGARLAVSLEAGCAHNKCGVLHFVERLGTDRGEATGKRAPCMSLNTKYAQVHTRRCDF